MSIKEIKSELKEIRNLNKHCISSQLTTKYIELFKRLKPLESTIMTECYINGKSYRACGLKVYYSERQVKRIVHTCIFKLNSMLNEYH
ncbi:MAG: hypothetical protein IKA85_06810 [Clostridia bacterium]|nr:hypothetical protein [Clostridia bacterium]